MIFTHDTTLHYTFCDTGMTGLILCNTGLTRSKCSNFSPNIQRLLFWTVQMQVFNWERVSAFLCIIFLLNRSRLCIKPRHGKTSYFAGDVNNIIDILTLSTFRAQSIGQSVSQSNHNIFIYCHVSWALQKHTVAETKAECSRSQAISNSLVFKLLYYYYYYYYYYY